MRKILLDGKEVESLALESLPMLIHGKEGSGASLYTICLAAKWFSQGYKILVLCGYKMAEEAFSKEVGNEYPEAKFFILNEVAEFIERLRDVSNNTIVIIKNIELFDQSLFKEIQGIGNLILSGDLDKTVSKEQLLLKTFTTAVYFSPIVKMNLPPLQKFQGYVISGEYKGITQIK